MRMEFISGFLCFASFDQIRLSKFKTNPEEILIFVILHGPWSFRQKSLKNML